jgi:hypothetical protein
MIVEGITPEEVAGAGNLPVGAVNAAIDRAVRKGLLFAPSSLIRRDLFCFPGCENTEERFHNRDTWQSCFTRSDRKNSRYKASDFFSG